MDYNVYKDDVHNRFTTYTFTEVTIGDGFVVEATVTSGGAPVRDSSWRMSLHDAYKDLRDALLDGMEVVPIATTTQRNAWTDIPAGFCIFNTTTASEECYDGSSWV